ncbi:MAG: epoxyqueuosine reductase QueH [Nitrospirota bacterium]
MKILLHICCSNCALYPLKIFRSGGHDFTGFWFNPNIHPLEEYSARLESLKKISNDWRIDMHYIEEFKPKDYFKALNLPLDYLSCHSEFISESLDAIRHMSKEILKQVQDNNHRTVISNSNQNERVPPAPDRCRLCYRLRLEKTAEQAQNEGFDAFSTTLLISPYQDFEELAKTGNDLAEKYNVHFHLEDFRPYFRDAMNLSRELGLYRQNYCGCIFSREERKKR